MKCGLLLMAFPLALLPLTGCESLTDTPAENGNRMVHAMDTNGKQIPDDVERILLLDRPTRLTEKPVPQSIVYPNKVYPTGTPYFFKDNP